MGAVWAGAVRVRCGRGAGTVRFVNFLLVPTVYAHSSIAVQDSALSKGSTSTVYVHVEGGQNLHLLLFNHVHICICTHLLSLPVGQAQCWGLRRCV